MKREAKRETSRSERECGFLGIFKRDKTVADREIISSVKRRKLLASIGKMRRG